MAGGEEEGGERERKENMGAQRIDSREGGGRREGQGKGEGEWLERRMSEEGLETREVVYWEKGS